MTHIEAMKQALEAFCFMPNEIVTQSGVQVAMSSLRKAIAEAEKQEPVAWMHTKIDGVAVPHRPSDLNKHPERWMALYTHPQPKREWVGLTDEELEPLCNEWRILFGSWTYEFAKAIEAKLKEKNHV